MTATATTGLLRLHYGSLQSIADQVLFQRLWCCVRSRLHRKPVHVPVPLTIRWRGLVLLDDVHVRTFMCACMCMLHTRLVTCALLQDPLNLESYLRNNIFLPDINNELQDKQATYADNLASLQRLVLYRFDDDTTGEGSRSAAIARAVEWGWCTLLAHDTGQLLTHKSLHACEVGLW